MKPKAQRIQKAIAEKNLEEVQPNSNRLRAVFGSVIQESPPITLFHSLGRNEEKSGRKFVKLLRLANRLKLQKR